MGLIIPEWNSSDTLCPDSLVQPGVDPDILGAHLLLSKLLDLLKTKLGIMQVDSILGVALGTCQVSS